MSNPLCYIRNQKPNNHGYERSITFLRPSATCRGPSTNRRITSQSPGEHLPSACLGPPQLRGFPMPVQTAERPLRPPPLLHSRHDHTPDSPPLPLLRRHRLQPPETISQGDRPCPGAPPPSRTSSSRSPQKPNLNVFRPLNLF